MNSNMMGHIDLAQCKLLASRDNKTVYLDAITNSAIKVFGEGYSKADILNEAHNHAIIEETGLPVPALKSIETISGRWAIVMDYIKGNTLAELIKRDAANIDLYIDMLIEVQLEIQDTRASRLNQQKDKMRRKIKEAAIDDITRFEVQQRLESMPEHIKVCHGDLNPTNIIIDEAGRPFILDWSHVTQGSGSADVARTYLLFRLNGEDDTAETYLNMFCDKTSIQKHYIQRWLPIVAVSQSVKGKVEEREFLLKWAGVCEYE